MSHKLRQRISWRRNKVHELLTKGLTQQEIADILKVTQGTIWGDVRALRIQAKENMRIHLEERLPMEFETCMRGINQVLKMSMQIAGALNYEGMNFNSNYHSGVDGNTMIVAAEDNRTRLQALMLANDCYKYKMELMTNGAVVADALRYVEQKQQQLDNIAAITGQPGQQRFDIQRPSGATE